MHEIGIEVNGKKQDNNSEKPESINRYCQTEGLTSSVLIDK